MFSSARAVAPILLLALAACSGDPKCAGPTVPKLPEGSAEYLDFWWKKGAGPAGQHLGVVIVHESGTTMLVTEADVNLSADGWQQLFAPVCAPTRAQVQRLELKQVRVRDGRVHPRGQNQQRAWWGREVPADGERRARALKRATG